MRDICPWPLPVLSFVTGIYLYHTCLFLWAREAEKAVEQGQSVQAARMPAPAR